MKKVLAFLFAVLILVSFASCGKVTAGKKGEDDTEIAETNHYVDPQAAFSDATLVNKADETNIYYLYADGRYKEIYKGSLLEGKWVVENGDRLVITMDGMETSYYYSMLQDADGNVTGITQMEGRSFDIVRHSVPDNVTAPLNAENPTE